MPDWDEPSRELIENLGRTLRGVRSDALAPNLTGQTLMSAIPGIVTPSRRRALDGCRSVLT